MRGLTTASRNRTNRSEALRVDTHQASKPQVLPQKKEQSKYLN